MDYWLPQQNFSDWVNRLIGDGLRCVGPSLVNQHISYLQLAAADQLTCGIEFRQTPGVVRATQVTHRRFFSWSNGAQGLKPYLFPSQKPQWTVTHSPGQTPTFVAAIPEFPKTVFIGARACDCAALKVQDLHFLQADCPDTHYQLARENLYIVAVDCAYPADVCFCSSMRTGPAVSDGCDIALTEFDDGFIVRVVTEKGGHLVSTRECLAIPTEKIESLQRQKKAQNDKAQAAMSRHASAENIFTELLHKRDSAYWETIGERCLACGNCTAVCPTCFCSKDYDLASLETEVSTHVREWSSCFAAEHSYIHGMQVRNSIGQRYRQWITHKMGSWHEQYGVSGCVGCGRCIAWCPVGIDITAEIAAVLA